jgi:ubiquinone/menaquinone biosynthesis C-methylase UbiE
MDWTARRADWTSICMTAFPAKSSALSFWRRRAAKYGSRAVINIACADHDLSELTAKHSRIVIPAFSSLLKSTDQTILDFGCGVGRFTTELSRIVQGKVIGVDIVESFLDIAPQARDVEYKLMSEGKIPLDERSVDVVWCFGVLGGILERKLLGETIMEFDRVLKSGGLLFLVENTTDKPSAAHWIFRSYREHQRLIDFVHLQYLGDYRETGERMSMMAGRKKGKAIDA